MRVTLHLLPLAAGGLLLAIGAARAETRGAGDTACARDVLVASSMQRQAIDQLEQAGSEAADQCRVWRRHVEAMRRIASVYGRCLSGAERTERLAQVQTSERDFSGMVKKQCKGL